jgi:hypothetical protein
MLFSLINRVNINANTTCLRIACTAKTDMTIESDLMEVVTEEVIDETTMETAMMMTDTKGDTKEAEEEVAAAVVVVDHESALILCVTFSIPPWVVEMVMSVLTFTIQLSKDDSKYRSITIILVTVDHKPCLCIAGVL